MFLTNTNIINQIGEYSTSGWDLYLMPQLPKNLDQFKNSYIYINNNNVPKLSYIKPDGKVEDVNIDDFKLFQRNKNLMLLAKDTTYFKPGMEVKLHLTEDETNTLITSNGGHRPTNKIASSLFQDPKKFTVLYEGCERYQKSHDKKIRQFERKFGELECLKELNKNDKCYFRKALMEYTTKRIQERGDELRYKAQDPDIRERDPKSASILLKDLLGKEGVALYRAALQEEANDKEFRKAVFCNSASHFEGPEWIERPVVIVSGPSASGKSFAAKAAVKESLEFLATKQSSNTSPGNYVIAADGGVIREVSQIRKWINKESTELGYPGVNDLHDRSQILEPIKKHVRQQALALPNLGVVIPETFSKWFLPGNSAKKMLEKILGLPNTKVIFVRVVGEDPFIFQKVVAYMGSSRAWKSFIRDPEEIERDKLSRNDLNSKEGMAESKSYGPGGFKFGVYGSLAAEKWFIENSKENLRMLITNDLILIKPTDIDDPNVGWMDAESNDKGVIKLPRRVYDDWERSDKPDKGSLLQFYQNNQKKYGILITTSFEVDLEKCLKQIDKLTASKYLNGVNKEKLNALQKYVEMLKPITRKPVEELSDKKDMIAMLCRDISNQKKWFPFETKTEKVFNQSLRIIENVISAKPRPLDKQTSSSDNTHENAVSDCTQRHRQLLRDLKCQDNDKFSETLSMSIVA